MIYRFNNRLYQLAIDGFNYFFIDRFHYPPVDRFYKLTIQGLNYSPIYWLDNPSFNVLNQRFNNLVFYIANRRFNYSLIQGGDNLLHHSNRWLNHFTHYRFQNMLFCKRPEGFNNAPINRCYHVLTERLNYKSINLPNYGFNQAIPYYSRGFFKEDRPHYQVISKQVC